jgi:WD40 repeat protein
VTRPAPPDAAATEKNPYVGLSHFTEETADRFFGRDTEIALIIGNLRASRLTLLYAESGVGKSSLLRAGVVARLHGNAERDMRSRGTPRLVPVVFSSWSEAPVAGLIRAIGDAVRPYLSEGARLDLPDDDLGRAIEVASEAVEATLLVILDQFEEYFLYPEEVAEPRQLATQVARCVNRPDLRANFLISLREDSYARLGDLFRGKIRNVYGNFLHLDFLDRAGARESIERPIEGAVEAEPALVDSVLDEVRRTPGASLENGADARDEVETTYLQLVMRRLWEVEAESESRALRLRTLEDLGGSEAIISGHLDRAMEGGANGAAGLTDEQRRVAASVFQFLVTSGGTKIALTAKDLSDMSGLPVAEIDPVLRHLSSPRLHILRPVSAADGKGETRFEIFHDALARPIVEWRTRAEEAERDAKVARERAEKESAQRAAAEAERREAQERKRKRLALALLGVAVAAMLGGAAYFAIDQAELADQRELDTQSIRAAQRILELSDEPSFGSTAAALASVEAYRLSPTEEARNQALAALQVNPGMSTIPEKNSDRISTVTYWPDSTNFASGGEDGTVRLWDAEGQELGDLSTGRKHRVANVVVSEPSNGTRMVAAVLDSGKLKLWKVDGSGRESPGESQDLSGSYGYGLAFNPRAPSTLAVATSNRRIKLLDLSNPRKPVVLGVERAAGEINDLAFDMRGRKLFAATRRGGQEWALSRSGFADSKAVRRGSDELFSVATAPNGSYAFAGFDTIDVHDAARNRELHLRQPEFVTSVAFARGSSVLVSTGFDASITTWDVATGRPFGPPRTVEGEGVYEIAVSSDGKTIASADDEGFLRLWPMNPTDALATTVGALNQWELDRDVPQVPIFAAGPGPVATEPASNGPQISGVAAGPDGQVAAAAGAAGTTIWKLRGPTEPESVPRPLTRIPGRSHAVDYHGDVLAVGRGDSFVLEDTDCNSMPDEPCRLAAPAKPHSEAPVSSLALFEHENRLLLVSSGRQGDKGVVNLWDVTDAAGKGEIIFRRSLPVDSRIHQVAAGSEGQLIAAGAEDGKLRVWDVSDPSRPRRIKVETPHGGGNSGLAIYAVAFSPDGALLASGGRDRQVALWEVAGEGSHLAVRATSGSLAQTQSRTILSISFSPDGETLATGDALGDTCLYDLGSRSPIGSSACLSGHFTGFIQSGGIKSVTFAQVPGGGTALLTAGTEQPIVAWDSLLWNLSDSDRVEQAVTDQVCELADRNLSPDQWNAIFSSTNFADDAPHRTCSP